MSLRTLVLTPFMLPHKIVPWDRGVTLYVIGKADVIDTYDVVCNSPSVSFQMPAVVRLSKEFKANKNGPKFSRPNVYMRDRYHCCYCNKRFQAKDLNYDHVLPRARGGLTDWDNIVTSCYDCNLRKDDRTPAEAGMHMHFQPYRPRVLPTTSPVIVDVATMPEQWKPWIHGHHLRASTG